MLDACIIGAGPNGLSAAITLARHGLNVQIIEAHSQVGGGLQTRDLTLPGFRHDVGSSIHPMAVASPAFRQWPLHQFGLEWVFSPAPFVHGLHGGMGGAVPLWQDIEQTAEMLGKDGKAWKWLFSPLVKHLDELLDDILRPLTHVPRHPLLLARFGVRGLSSADMLAQNLFQTPQGKALFGGLAAHASLPLSVAGTSAIALVLGALAHQYGYPFPRGGADSLARAMLGYFQSLGGEVILERRISDPKELPPARVYLVDSSPAVVLHLLGEKGSELYRWGVSQYRYGMGIQKFDYALSRSVPWNDPTMQQGATVHIGGNLAQMIASEATPTAKRPRPYVLCAQHTLFDTSRAPEGKHTFWAYAHVPNGQTDDIRREVEAHLEEYATGFGSCIEAVHVTTARDLERFSPVFVGGDVNGGASTLWQLLARPTLQPNPYRTPQSNLYLCSSATPPGGAVHGMSGYSAAMTALRDHFL